VGALFDAKTKILELIATERLDSTLTLGKVGLKAGFLLAFVKQDTPDDPQKLKMLQKAVKEVMGATI
jgi:hypothetical protein